MSLLLFWSDFPYLFSYSFEIRVFKILGLGLTGSIVLRSGRLSELISQLQELLKGVDDVQFSPYKYDHTLLAAQVLSILSSQNLAF